jgi:hypothetical protein
MNQSRIVCSAWQHSNANNGINLFLNTNILFRTVGSTVTGDTVRNAYPHTVTEYKAIWSQVLKFAIICEDYQSAAFLSRTKTPDNPFLVQPQLLAEYINWKSLHQEDPLYIYKTFTQIQYRTSDTTWEYLEPTGDWNCKVPLYKFRSAIMYLHRLYDNLLQQYFSKCTDCKQLCTRNVQDA